MNEKDIMDKLVNKKMRCFIKWYTEGANESEFKEKVEDKLKVSKETAMSYLDREDVQEVISLIVKNKRDINLINIYNTMVKNALGGDVQAANWVVKFSEGSFFNSGKNAIDEIVEELEIE